jgi:hypothetical protein
MTDLERELLATIERMNNRRDDQMLQATAELTQAVRDLAQYLAAFSEALQGILHFNRSIASQRTSFFERKL